LVQAENDFGDMAEMRDGVCAGLQLSEAERRSAFEVVFVARENRLTGLEFCARGLRPLLRQHRPDLLVIDPLLAFIGGPVNAQEYVGPFLRNGLAPLLGEFDCSALTTHHTNKPPSGREKPDWQASDFAYLGSGSSELANWPRAVLAIRSLGSATVFELRAGKRGQRLGWKEPDGGTAYARLIAHWREPGVICWREADPSEGTAAPGRPTRFNLADLLDLLPPAGLASADWLAKADEECGISRRRFFELLRDIKAKQLAFKSKVSDRWERLKK
jgi:hypothetical protein